MKYYTLIQWQLLFSILIACFSLGACKSMHFRPEEKRVDPYFMGVWRHYNDCRSEIIFRESDGTYDIRGILGFPINPPFKYRESGRWWVEGKYLCSMMNSVSYEPWKKFLNTVYKTKIIKVSPVEFDYLSSDNFDEKQIKIGDSIDEFNAYILTVPKS